MTIRDQETTGQTRPAIIWPFTIWIILGLGLSIWGGFTVIKSIQSDSWPSSTGEVLESDLKYYSNSIWAHVLYEYEVAGTIYTSDVIKIGDETSSSRVLLHTLWDQV